MLSERNASFPGLIEFEIEVPFLNIFPPLLKWAAGVRI